MGRSRSAPLSRAPRRHFRVNGFSRSDLPVPGRRKVRYRSLLMRVLYLYRGGPAAAMTVGCINQHALRERKESERRCANQDESLQLPKEEQGSRSPEDIERDHTGKQPAKLAPQVRVIESDCRELVQAHRNAKHRYNQQYSTQ